MPAYESTTLFNCYSGPTFDQSYPNYTRPGNVDSDDFHNFMQFQYDASRYPQETLYFDIAARVDNDGSTSVSHSVDFALFDSNDNKVSGSEVNISSEGGNNRKRSGSISLTDGDKYHVRIKTNNVDTSTSDGVDIYACRLIHQCSPSDTNFDFQDTYHMQLAGFYDSAASYEQEHGLQNLYFRNFWYESAQWDTQPEFAIVAQVNKPNTNSPVTIRAIDELADSAISGSEFSITGSDRQHGRSGFFTVPDDVKLINIEHKNGDEQVYYEGVRLLIRMPAPNNKFQLFHESPSTYTEDTTSAVYKYGGYYWKQSAWDLGEWTFGGNGDFGSATDGEVAQYDGHYHFGESAFITEGVDNTDPNTLETANVSETSSINSDGLIVAQVDPKNSTENMFSAGVFYVDVQSLVGNAVRKTEQGGVIQTSNGVIQTT